MENYIFAILRLFCSVHNQMPAMFYWEQLNQTYRANLAAKFLLILPG